MIWIWIKISSWNFQHLFIICLCKFDLKIWAITQPACQPRPISAETLDVSSDCICWDISKRKKLVGFWTHLSTLMEGISNIFKKMAFWNFSNECSVQVLHDVHGLDNFKKKCKYIPIMKCGCKLTIFQLPHEVHQLDNAMVNPTKSRPK